jgi:uncharacterized membrane protein YhaH (DUF805 family)
MSYRIVRDVFEWVAMIMLIVGIVTAAMDKSFGGFTPIIWFLIALLAILIIICTEVSRIREFLENKSKK